MHSNTLFIGFKKCLTRPSNIVRFALWTALRLRLLCMASPLLHKIHNHKSAVVGGVIFQGEFVHKSGSLIFIAAILMISACAPVKRDYYQPQHNTGELFSTGCSGSGPSSSLRVQLPSKANFTVRASSSEPGNLNNFYFLLSYHLPEGVTFKLKSSDIAVYSNNKELASFTIEKWATLTDIGTAYVSSSLPAVGETISILNLFGSTQYYKGYSVSLSSKLPNKYSSFTVKLPDIEINGVAVTGEIIEFKNVQKLGVDPLNC